jgi:hypothetical protein
VKPDDLVPPEMAGEVMALMRDAVTVMAADFAAASLPAFLKFASERDEGGPWHDRLLIESLLALMSAEAAEQVVGASLALMAHMDEEGT